jgi:hypothetical protein
MSKTKETLASRRKYIAKFGARAGTQITRKSYTEIPLQGNYHDPASILEIGRSGVMGLTKFEWTFDSDYRDFAEKLIKGNISLWGDSLSVFKNPLYDGLLDLHNTHKAVVGWAVPPNAVESGLFTPGEVQAIQNTQITLDLHLKVPTFQFEQDGTFSLNIDFRAAQDRITEQIDLLQVTLPGEPQEGQEGFGNIGSHWTKMATQDSSKGIGAELSSAEQLAEGMNSDEGKLIQSSEDVLYAMLRSKKFMKRMQRGADRYLQDQASDGSYKYSSTFTYGMGEILEAEAPASDTAGGKYAAKWHGGGGGRGKRAHWKKTWEGVSGTDAEQFEWADKKNIDILVTVKYGTSDYSAQFRQQLKTKLYAFVDEHGGLHNALKAIPAFRQSEAHREHMYYSKIWRRVSKKKRVWHAILDANDVNSFVTMMDSAVPHKDPGKVPSILDAPTKFAEQQTDQAEAKKKLDKLRKSKIVDELPKDVGSDKRVVSFCYLGDLLEAMFEYSGRIFDYENFGVVVGTTLCYDYFTDKMGAPVATEIALVDLPISKELFVSWFHREYIKTTTKSIPLGSFLKGLLSKVVTPYTSGQVFPWLTDNSKLRTEVKEHSLSTPKKFEYGTVKYEDFRGAMWGGGGPNSKLTSNKYKIFCGNLLSYDTKPPDMVLRLAQDRGLLKTAKFTRMGNMENYEALIMTNDNQNNTHGVTRVRIPYNVDLEFVGNTLFFPGTVFELSPTTPGLTSQNMARRLGLGGQYVAQSVTCTIDKEAGFTTEFMAVNSQMATMPGFVENPAVKKSQDDEVKKIIDQRKGKTDAAKEAAKGAPPRNQREKKKKNE